MGRRTLIAVPAAGALALALATGGASGATKRQTLHVKADAGGRLAFSKKPLVARRPGRITIAMNNPAGSGIPHGIGIDGHGVDRESGTVGAGSVARVTAKLKKGRYTFYCPVPGHRAAGMKGTLVVK